MTRTLKIGTRQSLLALAQSRIVARDLECLHPGLKTELVGISTRGDETLDIPLSRMEGKDFFVAEIDRALLDGTIDCTVHSLKDLSLERPPGLVTAAIPRRENPRDVVLFAPDIINRLKNRQPLRLGTSSPRRMENVPAFLANALPQYSSTPPQVECREIRGNVHTRISFLQAEETDPRKVDAVVLALAGLNRLWQDYQGQQVLQALLPGLRWMVLPLRECPAAPGQGALAIDCRADDEQMLDYLQPLHHAATARAVERERQVLADWGGGCHQSVGATQIHQPGLGELLYIRGRQPELSVISETRWDAPLPTIPSPAWDGSQWRTRSVITRPYADLMPPAWLHDAGALFIAHSRALPTDWSNSLADGAQRVWTSGTRSWLRLAARGIWVEGCAEELGFEAVAATLQSGVLELPALADWRILTHDAAAATWPGGRVIATYRAEPAAELNAENPAVIALRQARSIFWSSGSQYRAFSRWVPDNCIHACRYGKTYNYLQQELQQKNIASLHAFPTVAHWRTAREDKL